MKFHIIVMDFVESEIENERFDNNYFDLFHLYFCLSLFPLDLKLKLLDTLNAESKSVFEKIIDIDLNTSEHELTSFEECEYVLCPNLIGCDIDYLKLISFCKKYNKKLIIFDGSDYVIDIALTKNIFLFATGGYKSQNPKNVFGCPTFNNDYFSNKFLNKELSVGFCGTLHEKESFANSHPGVIFRSFIINQLKKYSYFNFIKRLEWGNIDNITGNIIPSSDKTIDFKSKQEFIQNIENNLYTLCVRGCGNFSFRLIETFMMGRIPILINSDCILPFENEIPYETNTVYVTKENSDNFTNIDKVIQDFHNRHSEEDILRIQKENRKIWIDYFTIDSAFYKTLDIIKTFK